MRFIGFLISIALLFGFIYTLDALTFSGIRALVGETGPDWLLPLLESLYWSVSMLLPVTAVYGFITLRKNHSPALWVKLAVNGWITQLITQLVFVVLWLGGTLLLTLVSKGGQLLVGQQWYLAVAANSEAVAYTVLVVAALIAAIVFFSFVYGSYKGKYRYKLHRHVLYFDDLPAAFDGFTITQISDIHSGSFGNKNAIQKGIDLINKQKSDLFLFTGDLVNNLAQEILPWKELFRQINAPFGQFSVLGNHDYGDYVAWPSREAKVQNMHNLIQYQRDMGFRLMLDEHVTIEKDGEKIVLIGIQNWGHGFSQYGDLNKALQGVEDGTFRILMSHDPSHFEHEVKDHDQKIHLTLSGHTHGMQMGFELFGWKWSPVKWRYPRWAGLYSANDRYLHINRGFGYLGFSGRVGIWPEVTVIELRRKL